MNTLAAAMNTADNDRTGQTRRGLPAADALMVSVEGVWGAGKSTTARVLAAQLRRACFDTAVLGYGPRSRVVQGLSAQLDRAPLRRRDGLGGYAAAHHATVDVLLRLCREADQHRHVYTPAAGAHDVVIIDHGVYSKLAYCLAVLGEQHPGADSMALLTELRAVIAPWFAHPDVAVWLDVPWPLARERAINRGRGGGEPGSVERLLFLPRYSAAYRTVADAFAERVIRIRVGDRGTPSVVTEIEERLAPVLADQNGGRR